MCGRFNLTATPEQVKEAFKLPSLFDFQSSYNITPGQDILAIVSSDEATDGNQHSQAVQLYWGLIPSWSKDRKISHNLINARAETIAEKPSFRSAFQKRRCLIPATGFFEWAQSENGKQAYHIARPNHQVFAFAGLWEHWEQGGETVYSCTIITTSANQLMQPIHSRMPVILDPQNYAKWLDVQSKKDDLQALLACDAYSAMDIIPVSNWVNNPRHDDVNCIRPLS
jgi:putative SOS response-associated peptidase YedK